MAEIQGRKGKGSHPAARHHPFHLWGERYGPREDWPTFPGGAAEDLSEIETKNGGKRVILLTVIFYDFLLFCLVH